MTNRTMRVLQLVRVGQGGKWVDLLPPLLDAEMVTLCVRGGVFRGIERQGDRDVAQSWYIEFHDAEPQDAKR